MYLVTVNPPYSLNFMKVSPILQMRELRPKGQHLSEFTPVARDRARALVQSDFSRPQILRFPKTYREGTLCLPPSPVVFNVYRPFCLCMFNCLSKWAELILREQRSHLLTSWAPWMTRGPETDEWRQNKTILHALLYLSITLFYNGTMIKQQRFVAWFF